MVANNDILFNAALAGVSGGALTRWITASTTAGYQAAANAAEAAALQIDTSIAPGAYNNAHANLLNQITAAVMTDRSPVSDVPTDYSAIAIAISSAFTEIGAQLLSESNFVSVATSGDLATLSASSGTIVYVRANRSYWGFVSGLQAIQATNLIDWVVGIGGAWARLNWGHPSYLRQPLFNISSAGDDNADINIKTHLELQYRLGPAPNWPLVDTTINILTSLTEVCMIGNAFTSAALATARYLGTPTTIYGPAAITTYTALNTAINQSVEMTDAAMTDYTTYLNKLVRITTGAAAGATALIMRRIGAQQAAITPFMIFTVTTGVVSSIPAVVNPAPGDQYVIEDLPVVQGIQFQCNRTNPSSAGAQNAAVFDRIQTNTATVSGANTFFSNSRGIVVTRSRILDITPRCSASVSFGGCYFPQLSMTAGDAPGTLSACGFSGQIALGSNRFVLFTRGCYSLAGPLVLSTGGACTISAEGLGIFNTSSFAVTLSQGGIINIPNAGKLWGSGNGNGILFTPGGILVHDNALPTLATTGAELTFPPAGGRTASYSQIPANQEFYDAQSGCGIMRN